MPAAFQRIPPMSQTEQVCPQEQAQIHSRDSASIDFAQASGKTASKNFWIEDIGFIVSFHCIFPQTVLKIGWTTNSPSGEKGPKITAKLSDAVLDTPSPKLRLATEPHARTIQPQESTP